MHLKSQNTCSNFNVNILPKHSDIHNYNARNNKKYNIKKSEMSINYKGIKVWNNK